MVATLRLTDVVAFDGAEHAEGLDEPAAVLQQAVQVGTWAKLTNHRTDRKIKGERESGGE